MRRRMWRFPLAPEGDEQIEGQSFTATLDMPVGAEITDVAMSSRGVTLYAAVRIDEDAPPNTELRHFLVCGNDVTFPEDATKVGLAKVPGGITAHVFELVQVEAPAPEAAAA